VVAEGGSIYPDDVVRVEQVFFKGALALIKDLDNQEIGQGLVNYSAYDVQSFIDNPMLAKVPRPPPCSCT
jgi:glutamate 5-kinase